MCIDINSSGDARQSSSHNVISCCVKMSHVYYGLKVCNKQSLCHFGTQTNKQFKSDSARLAFLLCVNFSE
ncbi:hypothetical protein THF5H11_320001 [Vibrio jasicida]|nr:hypothetical protein THF5H11_320001 [Vibrio jasicida]